MVERLVVEVKVLRERLVTEHSKAEFFCAVKEGQGRKYLKQLHELRQQVIHASQLADSTRREKNQAEADREMFAKANQQLHGAIEEWQERFGLAATETYQLLSENTVLKSDYDALKLEVETLKDYLKEMDAKHEQMKRAVNEEANMRLDMLEQRDEFERELKATQSTLDRRTLAFDEHKRLCSEDRSVSVLVLKKQLAERDDQIKMLQQELQETQNRYNTLHRELIDVGMENAILKEPKAEAEYGVFLRTTFVPGRRMVAAFDLDAVPPQRPAAKRSHPAFPENRKRFVFAHPANVISPMRLKRAKKMVGAALEAELNEF